MFYIDTQKPTFIDQLNMVDEPLATLAGVADAASEGGAGKLDEEPAVAGLEEGQEARALARASFLRFAPNQKVQAGGGEAFVFAELFGSSPAGAGLSGPGD